ncbi:MAG: hypothetical protein EA374_08545 [Acholeplasmatales bacterium]|nr:MAG: hypothetical protein EA374_08545 [Acholeplasmatales bacterium]
MKRFFGFMSLFMMLFMLGACDMIQDEIQRAQSIKLEDYAVDIPNRTISLHITSDADEPVITSVIVNDTRYDLEAEGDDWYLLSDVPVATSYRITDVFYRTSVGVVLSYNVGFDISLDDVIDALPQNQLTEVEDEIVIGAYTVKSDEEAWVVIDSEEDFTVMELEDWAWIILEDDQPVFAVFEYLGVLYVVSASSFMEDYLE